MKTVSIECKNDAIRRHCEREFGPRFRAELTEAQRKNVPDTELVFRWAAQLAVEAVRQQWWDYDETNGVRTAVKDSDGKNVPLYPMVRISG